MTTYNVIGAVRRNAVDQGEIIVMRRVMSVTRSLAVSLSLSKSLSKIPKFGCGVWVGTYVPSRVQGMTEGATGRAKDLYKRFVASARV